MPTVNGQTAGPRWVHARVHVMRGHAGGRGIGALRARSWARREPNHPAGTPSYTCAKLGLRASVVDARSIRAHASDTGGWDTPPPPLCRLHPHRCGVDSPLDTGARPALPPRATVNASYALVHAASARAVRSLRGCFRVGANHAHTGRGRGAGDPCGSRVRSHGGCMAHPPAASAPCEPSNGRHCLTAVTRVVSVVWVTAHAPRCPLRPQGGCVVPSAPPACSMRPKQRYTRVARPCTHANPRARAVADPCHASRPLYIGYRSSAPLRRIHRGCVLQRHARVCADLAETGGGWWGCGHAGEWVAACAWPYSARKPMVSQWCAREESATPHDRGALRHGWTRVRGCVWRGV